MVIEHIDFSSNKSCHSFCISGRRSGLYRDEIELLSEYSFVVVFTYFRAYIYLYLLIL